MAFFKSFAPDVLNTLKRFPVPMISTVAAYIYFCMFNFERTGETPESFLLISTLIMCGYFVFVIARLVAETHGWKLWQELLGGAIGAAGIYAIFYFYGNDVAFIWMPIILMLTVLVAPFLFRKSDNASFWYFLHRLAIGYLVSTIGGMVLGGGVVAAMASVGYLFDVTIVETAYFYVFYFVVLVYMPFIMLFWLPETFDVDPAACKTASGVQFILNWVLAPLAVLYFVILYAYGGKILIQWELPRGNVAAIVTGFGALGIFIYILGWALRDSGNKLLTLLYRHYFKLLILPVVLLFVAIMTRTGDYGMTEARYFVWLAAFWLGGMAILYTVRPQTPLKIIVATLAVMLFLASFGPWGAKSMSDRSQLNRLNAVLVKNNMMDEAGKVTAAKDKVSTEDAAIMSSVLDYYWENRNLKALSFLHTDAASEMEKSPVTILAALNVDYIDAYSRVTSHDEKYKSLSFTSNRTYEAGYDVRGYDYMYPITRIVDDPNTALVLGEESDGLQDAKNTMSLFMENGALKFRDRDVSFEVVSSDRLLLLANETGEQKPPVVITVEHGNYHLKFIILVAEIIGYEDGTKQMGSIQGTLMLRK